jgi:hypothetical protein
MYPISDLTHLLSILDTINLGVTRLGSDSPWINTIRIESLGHEMRLGLWVELGLKTNSCNLLISLCKVTHHYSRMESCTLPQTRSVLDRKLGKQILCVLSLFLSMFNSFACVYNCHPRCFGCVIT